MEFRLDSHTHTLASGHAYCTLLEMVRAAADRGLELICITDHAPGMELTTHKDYFLNFRVIDREIYGVRVMMGAELNVMDFDGTVDLSPKLLNNLDMAIASQHIWCMPQGGGPEENTAAIDVYKRQGLTGHAAALLTIFLWGTTFISTKVLLTGLRPVEVLFLRFALGFAALCLLYPQRLRLAGRRQELWFAAAGLCGVTLYFLLENIALTCTLASNVGVLVSVSPMLTALLSHFLLRRERLRPLFFAGLAVALAGVAMVSYNGAAVLELNPCLLYTS